MGGTLSHLLKKYDVPGPRYTSYPTIPYWQDTPDQETWLAHLGAEAKRMASTGRGAALYLHLPFCSSLCTFCACNRIITKKNTRNAGYIQSLQKEWALYQQHLGTTMPMGELHLGGGTPTFFSPEELSALLGNLLDTITLTPDAELSLEADPRVTTTSHLGTLASLGFTRISLGVQDYDPTVQKAINRLQPKAMVGNLVREARKQGFTGINYDLVYGLPHQTLATVADTIETVIEQRPDRIAFYAYAHVPWIGKTGQRGFDENDLPVGEAKRALYEHGRTLLQQAGYVDIGMDHFALPHDALCKAAAAGTLYRNFMGYVPQQVSPLIGLGVSSISDAWSAFVQNEKDLDAYEAAIAANRLPLARGHILTTEDLMLRRSILDLMTCFSTSLATLDTPTADRCRTLLQEPLADGLLQVEDDTITISEKGRPFIRNICMAFDARLQQRQPQTQIFSRTI